MTDEAAGRRRWEWAKTLDEREAAMRVSAEGDRITLTGGPSWPEVIDLTKVTTISMAVSNRSGAVRRYMEFRGARTHKVPVLAQGFDVLVGVLKQLPGFDAVRLEHALRSAGNERVTVLAVPLRFNARLLTNAVTASAQFREQFATGLVLVREAGEIPLSWDVTYDDLTVMPGVSVGPDEYDQQYARLGRVRLGGLELDDLRARLPKPRTDVPVQTWQTAAVLTHGGDENYRLLKEYFEAVMENTLKDAATYERVDQNAWRGQTAGVRVGLVYWYDSEMTPESRYCSLTFENARTYPEYLHDAYSETMSLESVTWARFEVIDVRVERNFRKSVMVRQTPPAVRMIAQSKDEYVVWRDDAAEKIGFADPEFAVIADAANAKGLELQNVSPGKGGGYAELWLVGSTDERLKVGSGKYRGLDRVAVKVAELMRLPIKVLEEFNDS